MFMFRHLPPDIQNWFSIEYFPNDKSNEIHRVLAANDYHKLPSTFLFIHFIRVINSYTVSYNELKYTIYSRRFDDKETYSFLSWAAFKFQFHVFYTKRNFLQLFD